MSQETFLNELKAAQEDLNTAILHLNLATEEPEINMLVWKTHSRLRTTRTGLKRYLATLRHIITETCDDFKSRTPLPGFLVPAQQNATGDEKSPSPHNAPLASPD